MQMHRHMYLLWCCLQKGPHGADITSSCRHDEHIGVTNVGQTHQSHPRLKVNFVVICPAMQ